MPPPRSRRPERGTPGVYNVVDDEPAQLRDWLPVYAEALGAKPPRRVPAWLARLVAGPDGERGDCDARRLERQGQARAGLGAGDPSWRQGFRDSSPSRPTAGSSTT